MPAPPMQPEYIEIGEPRHGLWPADKRRELDSVYGREKRRGTVVRLGNEKPHLTEKERQRTAEHRNIFGGLRRVEGWLLKQVSLGMGTAWRPFYFRLSELHGGSLEYDRQPLCHGGKLRWPPIEIVRLHRLEDVGESALRPHAFKITLVEPPEEILLQAASEDAMLRWMRSLRASTEPLRQQMSAVVLRLRWCEECDYKTLGLASLELRRVPPQTCELVRLQECDLSDNQVPIVPHEIHQLTALKRLNLSGNCLSTMPRELGKLGKLFHLDLSNNRLSHLPESVGGLTSLKFLALNANQLSRLPVSVGGLTALRDLNCLSNNLAELPQTLAALTSCTKLSVANNELEYMPNSLGALTTLRDLDIGGNMIKTLPETIGGLTNLQKLACSRNMLTQIPVVLGGITSLVELNLRENHVAQLPESMGALVLLQGLDLGHNKLQWLPEAFGGLTGLRRLDLRSNKISELPPWIAGLSSLQQLDLGYNCLFSTWARDREVTEEWRGKTPSLLTVMPAVREPWRRGAVWYEQLRISATIGVEAPEADEDEGGDDSDDDSDDSDGGPPPTVSHYPMFELWQRRYREGAERRARSRRLFRRRWRKRLKKWKRKRALAKKKKEAAKQRAQQNDEGDEDGEYDDDDDDDDDDDEEEDSDSDGGKGKKKKRLAAPVRSRPSIGQRLAGLRLRLPRRERSNSEPTQLATSLSQVEIDTGGANVGADDKMRKKHSQGPLKRVSRAWQRVQNYVAAATAPADPVYRKIAVPRFGLPPAISRFGYLTFLDLRENRIRCLPRYIGDLRSLRTLDVSFNFLREVPDALGNLGTLRRLRLRSNKIRCLPKAFGGNLPLDGQSEEEYDPYAYKYSDYSSYSEAEDGDEDSSSDESKERKVRGPPRTWQIGTSEPYDGVPDAKQYAGLFSLTELDLFDNKLHRLPHSIDGLSSLVKLDLSHNRLIELPDTIGALTNLVDLRVRKNKLKALPHGMGDLDAADPCDIMRWMEPGHGLCVFDRSRNPMQSPPADHFTKHWSIPQILEFLRDHPEPQLVKFKRLKDAWAYVNAPPISYNMTPLDLETAGHRVDQTRADGVDSEDDDDVPGSGMTRTGVHVPRGVAPGKGRGQAQPLPTRRRAAAPRSRAMVAFQEPVALTANNADGTGTVRFPLTTKRAVRMTS